MNKCFQRGRHKRNGNIRTYRQEDSYQTGGKGINMNNEKSFEIFINNSFVGKVIGKGGSKIRELQDESNAYIKVLKNDSGSVETPIMLSGTAEAIEKAESLIGKLITGVSNSLKNFNRAGERAMNMNNEKYSEILINNSLVGKVIGKGGSKIRELQDESSAYIKVLKNDSGSVKTPIMLSGTPEAIEKAKRLIENLVYGVSYLPVLNNWTYKVPNNYTQPCENEPFGLEELPEKSKEARLMNMDGEKSSEIFVDNSFVGKVIGKGGSKVKELQDESNAYIKVLKNNPGSVETPIMLSGTPEAIEKAKHLIGDLVYGVTNLPPQSNWMYKTPINYPQPCENETFDWTETWLNRLEKSEEARLMDMDSEKSSEIFVENSFVGKIIGRGGFKIRELKNESNAYIKVLKNDIGASTTSIRLTGTWEAVERAKSLIEDLISDASHAFEKDFYRASRWKNMDNKKSSEIVIHNNFVDKMNGKGAFKTRELQDTNKTKIKVLKNDSAAVADTSIRLTETPEAIEYDAPNLFVQNNQIKSPNNYIQASEDEPFDWAQLQEKNEEAILKKLASLPAIIKNFYEEDPEVSFMRSEDVKKIRKENNCISVMKIDLDDDRQVPNPVTSFKQAFHNFPELLEELRQNGFSAPSPIQSQAWPILLQGYDMIGIAQTGTGKTIAFLFPALVHIIGQVTPREERVGPSALILAPTRELAQQIEAEVKKYQYKGITSICIYGGGNRRNQINVLTKGIDIIIATPGRLNDLCMNEIIDVSGVTYLVLDEADRMLDMGFEPQIRKIVIDIREDRQTVMTSATWTEAIQELATRYMKKPFKVKVGAFDLSTVHSVTQEIIFAEDDYDERRKLLDEFIKTMGPDDKAIVFVEKKAIADDIANDLNLRGTQVQSIHGDREQCDREQALDDLKTGYVKILIATDVASRGLDIKDITIVFNLFFPRNIEAYVHRVGRTGRAGRTGKAISVVTRGDWNHAADLIKLLNEADQYVPHDLYDLAARYKSWKCKKKTQYRVSGSRR